MSLPNAVDMSKWGGELTADEARCLREAGIVAGMIGTGPGGYGQWAGQQADQLLTFGMSLYAYHYLEWGTDPESWVRAGVQALWGAAKHVVRGYANVEHPIDWGTLDQRIAHVRRSLVVLDGAYELPGGVSTGKWYWAQTRYMANTTAFADRVLQNAYYDEDADISGMPYGGWTQASVEFEQFKGTTDLCGQSVDFNYLYGSNGAMTEQEDLIISIYRDPGMEDASHDEQLANARMRMAQRLTIRGSVNDQLISHLTVHPGPSGGSSGGHTHTPNEISHSHPASLGDAIPATVAPLRQRQP